MSRLIIALAVAVLARPLVGCTRGIRIQISGPITEPTFTFLGEGLFSRRLASVDGLSIIDVTSVHRRSIWSLSRDHPTCEPAQPLRYGVVPRGWRVLEPAHRLEPGRTYALTASGCAFYGGIVFKIRNGSVVFRDGNGDAPIQEVQGL